MKTYIPLKKNPEATDLQVNVFYDKGGSSCFSDRVTRRGIYLSVTPVTRDGGFVEQKLFTGLKQLREETGRYSNKKLFTVTQSVLVEINLQSGPAWDLVLKVLEQEKLELEEVNDPIAVS